MDINSLMEANDAYRNGVPFMSDAEYDSLWLTAKEKDPKHEFFEKVEPEQLLGGLKIRHENPMLSTEKAYDLDEIKSWIKKIMKVAKENGIPMGEVAFIATPKLDGMAGKYINSTLATRGDGDVGNDVTSSIAKGIVAVGGANTGVGEIVMDKNYFKDFMSEDFSHPRNVVVGIVSADTPNDDALKALKAGVVRFVPYSELDCWRGNAVNLLKELDEICDSVEDCSYPVDGTVIEIAHEELKEIMGSASTHHNWQIAKKRRGESKICNVLGITWQIGRTGRITPVINIEPTKISGAVISNVTGHHAGNIISNGVGIGAKIEVIRSGEVIPFLASVKETASVEIPTQCPSCSGELEMESDFLVCNSSECQAQVETKLLHWFRILGNVDGFGPSTISKLVDSGIDSVFQIYSLTIHDFYHIGFGEGQSKNLVSELARSRTDAINDWRFLAAFGIHHLGKGDSKKLLKNLTLQSLTDASEEFLISIDGFGEKTSRSVSEELNVRYEEIMSVLSLGFNVIQTKSDLTISKSPITDQFIVFTGGMTKGTRDVMKEGAEVLGAKAQSSINKKTTMLVIGNKASQAKITKAESLGAKVLTEDEYYNLINGET